MYYIMYMSLLNKREKYSLQQMYDTFQIDYSSFDI